MLDVSVTDKWGDKLRIIEESDSILLEASEQKEGRKAPPLVSLQFDRSSVRAIIELLQVCEKGWENG